MSDIATPQFVPVIKRRLRLRWAFEYAARPRRAGVWNGASNLGSDGAWAQPKDGLVWAVVEGEDLITYEIVRMIEVPGPDYATAEWEVYAPMPGAFLGVAIDVAARVSGLSLLSRDERITAGVDGSITRRLLTDDERRFDLHEHRAGT